MAKEEYVDVDIIENGRIVGTAKVLKKTKEAEEQIVKLDKVDDKTAYENLLIKEAELIKETRLLGERCNQLLKDKGELTDKIADIKANCDFALEGKDVKIMELETESNKLLDVINNQDIKIADLEQKLEQTEKDLTDYQFNYPKIKELEKTIKLLGERCNQLLKDKGELIDKVEKMKSIGRTAYIKGIRTMANALKDYDRTEGAWTDYFEHTVDKVLKKLLGEIKEK